MSESTPPQHKRRMVHRLRQWLKHAALFPVTMWLGSKYLSQRVQQRQGGRWGKMAGHAVHWLTYILLGLPLTLLITGEILISLNGAINAESGNTRMVSDHRHAGQHVPMDVPGIKFITPLPKRGDDHEKHDRALVEHYAPVILQKTAGRPQYDIPTAIDFDGNEEAGDNVANERYFRPVLPVVYGEVTAETIDSFYLTYSLYHVMDYDHPIRELATSGAFHESDNEGLHMRVDKKSMQVVEVETWFHNRFLLFNLTGLSKGTEPVHGKIHVEGSSHVIVYSQPQGHGVRLAQTSDLALLDERVKILRYAGNQPVQPVKADDSVEWGSYRLDDFDLWYRKASLTPYGDTTMFNHVLTVGKRPDGTPLQIGQFIVVKDKGKWVWVKPKPMWSWDDGWDELPIFVWHFFPSMSFASHGGTDLSHAYLRNRPARLVFDLNADELLKGLDLTVSYRKGSKWKRFNAEEKDVEHWEYWKALRNLVKNYVNYVFHALG